MSAGNGFGYESGANGDAAAAGNTGADFVSATGGTAVISTAQKAHGTRSLLMTATSTSGALHHSRAVATDDIAVHVYVYWAGLPSGSIGAPIWLGDTAATQLTNLEITTTGQLRIRDDAQAAIWTSTATMAVNTWYRIEFAVHRDPSAGTARAAFYTLDSLTPVADSGTLTGVNTGASQFKYLRVGLKTSTSTATATAYLDDWDYDPTTTTFLGPVGNNPPVVSVTGAQSVAAAAAVTASVTATDDGSIASYAWSVLAAKSTATPTLTGAATTTVSLTAPAAGNLVTLQCIVTDDQGATTTVTTEVRVPKTGAFTVLAIAGTGSWTNTGGAANTGAAVSDASDTTYVESPDYSGVESEFRWRMEPLVARTALDLVYRNQVTATGGTKKLRLYEGNTLRQEWTLTPHTAIADDTVSVTNPGAIVDWGNLWVAEVVTA